MKCSGIVKTLSPLAPTLKRRVRKLYATLTDKLSPLNQTRRAALAEAVFQVENDLEHRLPTHPGVTTLRQIRNALYDDLRWNETPPHPQPSPKKK